MNEPISVPPQFDISPRTHVGQGAPSLSFSRLKEFDVPVTRRPTDRASMRALEALYALNGPYRGAPDSLTAGRCPLIIPFCP